MNEKEFKQMREDYFNKVQKALKEARLDDTLNIKEDKINDAEVSEDKLNVLDTIEVRLPLYGLAVLTGYLLAQLI